jgi:hypothetical protein
MVYIGQVTIGLASKDRVSPAGSGSDGEEDDSIYEVERVLSHREQGIMC